MIAFIIIFMSVFNLTQNIKVIFEFDKSCNIDAWQVVDDILGMGGKSHKEISLNKGGNGVFKGIVSLKIMEAFLPYV